MKILLAEDQGIVARALQNHIEKQEGMKVCGLARNGKEAVALFKNNTSDIAVLDIRMPVMTGIEAAKEIKAINPDVKIVFLTTFNGDMELSGAAEIQPYGFFLKDIEPEDLTSALRCINAGLRVYDNSYFDALTIYKPKTAQDSFHFTESEKEIIHLLGKGMANKEITAQLGCSLGTVKNRISAILQKTGFADRTQIVIYALKNGLYK